MKEFTLIKSTNDLPKPGKTVYLIIIRYIDYKDGKQVILRRDDDEELDYSFAFARYAGNGDWQRIGGEMTGYIENLEDEDLLPSLTRSELCYSYPDDDGGSDIDVRCDVIAYYELPKTPSAEVMQSIPQAI